MEETEIRFSCLGKRPRSPEVEEEFDIISNSSSSWSSSWSTPSISPERNVTPSSFPVSPEKDATPRSSVSTDGDQRPLFKRVRVLHPEIGNDPLKDYIGNSSHCSFCLELLMDFTIPPESPEMKLIHSFLAVFSASSAGTLNQLPVSEIHRPDPQDLCKFHELENSFINALSQLTQDQILRSSDPSALNLDSGENLRGLLEETLVTIERMRPKVTALVDSLPIYDELVNLKETVKQKQKKGIKLFFEYLIRRHPKDKQHLEVIQQDFLKSVNSSRKISPRKKSTRIGLYSDLKENFEIVSDFVQKISKVSDPDLIATGISFVNELLKSVEKASLTDNIQGRLDIFRRCASTPANMSYIVSKWRGRFLLCFDLRKEVDRLRPEDKFKIFGDCDH